MESVCPLQRPRRTPGSNEPPNVALIFGHGTFQGLTLALTTLSLFVSFSNSFSNVAFARPVDHWCKPPPELANTTIDVWKNQSIPVEPDGTLSQCTRYEPPLEQAGNTTENRTVVFCSEWDYNLTTTGQTVVSQWNLVCSRRWLLLLQSDVFFGAALTTVLAGYIGDYVGRKPVFMVALLLFIGSGMATIFSNTMVTFTALRFLASATSMTVVNMASVLLFEVTDSKYRVVYCAFAISCSSVMFPLFQFLLIAVPRHWTMVQAMVMVPTCLLLFAAYGIEESPSWLLATGDLKRTRRAVLSAASMNGLLLNDVKAKMKHIKQEQWRRGSIMAKAEGSNPLDLIWNSSLRFRSAAMFACWFVVLLHYYDTLSSQIIKRNSTAYITYHVLRIPVTIAFILVLHKLSRRRLLCIFMAHMSVVLGFQAWLVQQKDDSFMIVVSVILEGVVLEMILMTAFVYTIEVFPILIRGTAFSLAIMFGRSGGILIAFIRGPEPQIDRALALALSSVLFTLIGVAILWLPETTQVVATNTSREAEEANPVGVTGKISRLFFRDVPDHS